MFTDESIQIKNNLHPTLTFSSLPAASEGAILADTVMNEKEHKKGEKKFYKTFSRF